MGTRKIRDPQQSGSRKLYVPHGSTYVPTNSSSPGRHIIIRSLYLVLRLPCGCLLPDAWCQGVPSPILFFAADRVLVQYWTRVSPFCTWYLFMLPGTKHLVCLIQLRKYIFYLASGTNMIPGVFCPVKVAVFFFFWSFLGVFYEYHIYLTVYQAGRKCKNRCLLSLIYKRSVYFRPEKWYLTPYVSVQSRVSSASNTPVYLCRICP